MGMKDIIDRVFQLRGGNQTILDIVSPYSLGRANLRTDDGGLLLGALFSSVATDRTDADVDTAQSIFDSGNDTITLEEATTYLMKLVCHISSTGTASANMTCLFAGSATLTSIGFAATSNHPATETRGAPVASWAAAATPGVNVTQTVAAARFHTVVLEGLVRVNVAGTFIPQYKFSGAPGAAPIVYANSYLTLIPIGSNTIASIGDWS